MQDTHAHQQSSLDPRHKDQLPVILSFIDDSRRLIEAGKGRRWEVFKWAMAINLLLVPTAYAHQKFPFPAVAFDNISGVSSLLAIALILHYDRRIDGARRRSHGLVRWIAANIIDVSASDRDSRRSRPASGLSATLLAVDQAIDSSPDTTDVPRSFVR
jgi:hypothetical protein